MYPEYMQDSLKKVEASRPSRLRLSREKGREHIFPAMTAAQREEVLQKFHPDYKKIAKRPLRIGVNKGESITTEVADILEAYSRINPDVFDLNHPDMETDVLIVGGGSAACSAALLAEQEGVNVLLVTKLRLGDSNSIMAQGGIQAAVNPQDSPIRHYLDVMGGGHFDNKPELVEALSMDAPLVIDWLIELGVMFDRNPDGSLKTRHGGGTSRTRMLSCKDYSGSGILRVLRDEIECRKERIRVIDFSPVVELIMDTDGRVAGAILQNFETDEYFIVKSKAVILATGGMGRLHIQGFPTTNHYGATCDGVVLGYRAGARLIYMDSVQYHPTGAVFPEQILGFLVTEKVRGLGGQPVNKDGYLFVFPLEPRDVESSAFIRECVENHNGVKTPSGQQGIWLDSPIIEELEGVGTVERELPAMVRQFKRFNIDITKEPMLVYPTLHFQNGGLDVNARCETSVPGLYAAGEVQGGTHGRNRLMGNSQLEITVFGRRAGTFAAQYAKSLEKTSDLTLEHVRKYNREVEKIGIDPARVSPILLPDYIPNHVKERQLTSHYLGAIRG
ncbi:FAD-binding protein [Candidatus Sumerlaeota bacterium]|nr:FAD-binding protein [Candidatus Sumerlaeota bacterium]